MHNVQIQNTQLYFHFHLCKKLYIIDTMFFPLSYGTKHWQYIPTQYNSFSILHGAL